MKDTSLLKQIKRIPYVFLAIVIVNIVLAGFLMVQSVGQTEILNVNVKNLKLKTLRTVELEKDFFQTGSEGKLYWKVKNYNEAFLVLAANRDSAVNFYDLFYLLVLDICLFIMVFRMDESTVFSNQVRLGFHIFGFSVVFYAGIVLLSYRLSGNAIEELTNGRFTAQYREFNIPKYLVISYLIFFLAPFVQKGKSLQNEQDLTI